MALFFFLVYGSANQISALTAPHPSFFWSWERELPFVPALVLPYVSSDIVFVIAFLVAPARSDIQRLALRSGLAVVVSATFFLAMPLQFSFVRPAVDGWPSVFFGLLSLDQPYNQFPSLHISLGFLAWHVIGGRLNGVAYALTTLWFLLIAASTLLVFQHHAIDVIGGAAVVVVVFWLVPACRSSRIRLNFVTPRHLRMALRYLVAAAAAAVAAFNAGPTGMAFGWVTLSLVCVAASYALGANGFLAKSGRRHSVSCWLTYGPFLTASWLNWRYWRGRVPLLCQVAPGVWIGARPAKDEWSGIGAIGIRSVIDLVPELSGTAPADMHYTHAPLLDIAIPDPVELDRIARQIERRRQHGGVYVHCALGMSRSVLAACAWMMSRGSSKEVALERIDRARPDRVRRPYIAIALELYEDHLNKCRLGLAAAATRVMAHPVPRG